MFDVCQLNLNYVSVLFKVVNHKNIKGRNFLYVIKFQVFRTSDRTKELHTFWTFCLHRNTLFDVTEGSRLWGLHVI